MIPLVLNADLSRLVQINMQASVGQRGRNVLADVKLVQAMLNNVPVIEGGPSPKLTVDGRVGPMTIGTITRFQRAAKGHVIDGLINPAGPTITALGSLLNSRDLLPRDPVGIGPPNGSVLSALRGVPTPPPRNSLFGINIPFVSPTDWKFKNSASISLGISFGGLATGKFLLEKDSRPGLVQVFPWVGVGVGLSVIPVTLAFSTRDMLNFGLRLRQGLRGRNPMPDDDLIGNCTVLSFDVNMIKGVGGTVCFFGTLGPIGVSARAIGAIVGSQVGIPGASITGFFGKVDVSGQT